MGFSTIPFLFAGLIGFVAFTTRRAVHTGAVATRDALWIVGILAGLVAWALACAQLARSGALLSDALAPWLPGLWMPLVPIAAVLSSTAASPPLRRAAFGVMDATPISWFVVLHALRIAALGTFVKTLEGSFPLHFELGVGIPDLVFGLSAPLVGVAIQQGALGWRGMARWHAVGFGVVAIPAPPLLQLGLPGPLQMFEGTPSSEVLFQYPMALAPCVVVPCFLLLNLGPALWLRSRRPR